ncbi:hypothetical protein QFZ23_001550 [Arthrobacter globiformis]|uniref:FHA domain-containing protein n=1 Tax=Arthrobacter globiformis TaxID=1665 RepID=UPI00277DC20B|nr:FHA domain-containing protein [Arthrobacter globiformis]MDQ1057649.1 hypothetical protein [Arthrobacter globiformis]
MASASYVPGGWLGLIRSGTAVILDPATPGPLVSTVWDLLAKGPDASEVLHAVTGGFGAPLSASPWFGIIGFSDSLRVFLRGEIDMTVRLPSGPVKLDGRNVTTWTERWMDAPEWFSVAVPAAATAQSGSSEPGSVAEMPAAALPVAELPLVEGAVLLRSLRVSVTEPGSLPSFRLETATISTSAPPLEASAETMVAPAEDLSLSAEPVQEVSAETVAGLQETITGFTGTGAATAGTLPEEALPEAALPKESPSQESPSQESPSQESLSQEDSPATELTSSYDHLWDKTVVRSIEGAAVRTGQEDDGGAPAVGERAVPETAIQETAVQEIAGQEIAGQDAGSPEAGPPVIAREAAAPAPPSAPAPSGLIDSVPWATGGDSAPGPGVPPSFSGPQVPPSFIPVPEPREAAEGDHDGQTILKSDLPAPGGQQAGQGQEPGQGAAAGNGPMVLARVCHGGHANPPTSGQCFTCGAQLPDVAIQVPRPRLGRLRLSTGELIDLEQSLVIGRQPSVSRVQGGTMPRLVQVASPGGDISRSHVEVRLEGWHVMLCDLKATNGTVLIREGQPPRRLAQNEMAIILDGDIAELGDDVSLRFEEIL